MYSYNELSYQTSQTNKDYKYEGKIRDSKPKIIYSLSASFENP